MAVRVKQLSVTLDQMQDSNHIFTALHRDFGIEKSDLLGLTIKKKSLDARRKSRILYHYQLDLQLREEEKFLKTFESSLSYVESKPDFSPLDGLEFDDSRKDSLSPVIIGSGPSGIFAALILADAGYKPIVIERGEPVEKRMRTVNRLRSRGTFDEKSNFCFGEGGAGTFSDGKLTCGRNHPLIRYLFIKWVEFGAPEDILYEAHPHIGTDYLMKIAINMRRYLESRGVQFVFNRKMEKFERCSVSPNRKGSKLKLFFDNGDRLETRHLILAIGHSARDTYQSLVNEGVAMVPKPFAIGARIEHPQSVIDDIQFGKQASSCYRLPAAEYKLTSKSGQRGIWTFCMCPGGHLLPTGAQAGHLAINGMSYHARNSGFANAAVVVGINRDDYFKGDVLDGVRFQASIETEAFQQGGGNYYSPAQKLTDFISGRSSRGELVSTYKPGVTSARLDKILPGFVSEALRSGLKEYNQRMKGFLCDEAIVAGVETKTSAPVVIQRGKDYQSTSHEGLFPCGEGAGFAGGIVSAALDGVKVGRAVVESLIAEDAKSNKTLTARL